jgi:L-serine dehydratase
MESIREIYKIGYGPSSSHTMAPRNAAEEFLIKSNDAPAYRVTLYGSLALTGKGHLTDKALGHVFEGKKMEIVWKSDVFLPEHPNGMLFESLTGTGEVIREWKVFSIGGGALSEDGKSSTQPTVYEDTRMMDILKWCVSNSRTFWEYVIEHEGENITEHLERVWDTMQETIARGLEAEGALPGFLKVPRKAAGYYYKSRNMEGPMKSRGLIFSYALAVSEENAAGGKMVTAPTCGACGVLPAVLYHGNQMYGFSRTRIIHALATAGLIGNLVKHNASISGAKVGCQGEIGTACAMASGALVQLLGGTTSQVEYAAQMGLEHFLGLTCDPIGGLVQIPCIERNAYAAARANDANTFALLSDGKHIVSFDKVVEAMNRTGHDMPKIYKETSLGGLASLW